MSSSSTGRAAMLEIDLGYRENEGGLIDFIEFDFQDQTKEMFLFNIYRQDSLQVEDGVIHNFCV
jgi:hypothetical protein